MLFLKICCFDVCRLKAVRFPAFAKADFLTYSSIFFVKTSSLADTYFIDILKILKL